MYPRDQGEALMRPRSRSRCWQGQLPWGIWRPVSSLSPNWRDAEVRAAGLVGAGSHRREGGRGGPVRSRPFSHALI